MIFLLLFRKTESKELREMAEWMGRTRKYQEFVGFEFNGVHSSQLNLYRVSDGNRYNEDMSAAFQDKTVQAPGSDGTFYFGTNYTQRTFNISFAFDAMTEDDMHEFRRIFAAKEEGYLIFDESNYKKYKVKIQSPPQLKYICFDNPDNDVREVSNVPYVSKGANGKIIYKFENINNSGRIYKGEGTIQFIAYYPFAIEVNKYLVNYNKQNTDNLIPQNYYSPQTKTSYGVTFEKREDEDNYGEITMEGTHSTNGESYYIFTHYNDPFTIKTSATYYINPTISTDFEYVISKVNKDGTRERIFTANSTTIRSSFILEDTKVWSFLKIKQSNARTINNPTGFFPVFTSNSISLMIDGAPTPNTALHSLYPLKGTSISDPYAKYIGYYDWKDSSRMKKAKMISDEDVDGSLYFDTATVITTTAATSSIIGTVGGAYFKRGDTVAKLYNAGEIDSDLVFYTTAWTDTTAGYNYTDFVKRPTIIQLIKHSNKDGEDYWQVIEQLNLSSDLSRYSGDRYIRYNSKTNLLEGGKYNANNRDIFNFPFEPTGTIYNRFITNGNFFKVPAYEEGVTYYLRATTSNEGWNPTAFPASLPTTSACTTPPTSWNDTTNTYKAYRCFYSTIKYNHVWY